MDSQNNPNCTGDEEIQMLLKKIAHEEGFQEYQIKNIGGSTKGDGYIGIINNFTIEGKDAKNKSKTLNLIVKIAPKSDAFRSQMPVALLFQREIFMYDTIFPMFQTFEMENGLAPSNFAPKFYKANTIPKSETIIMENLKDSGYQLYERRRTMDHDHVSFVMAQYGRFHAISFALRDQHPEEFATAMDSLSNVAYERFKETFLNTMVQKCTTALKTLDPKSQNEAVKKCQRFIDRMSAFFDEMEASVDKYSVIIHGDCWTNNMMFKYEDANNLRKPTQVRFVDFQLSKIGSPVLDLAFFFYACSSAQIINNLSHYMQLYYDSLSFYLRKLGSNPDQVYPYSVLQQQWKKFGKFGLPMTAYILHAMLSDDDEAIDLKDAADSGVKVSDAFNYDIANTKEYNDRIRHIILHLVDNDFI